MPLQDLSGVALPGVSQYAYKLGLELAKPVPMSCPPPGRCRRRACTKRRLNWFGASASNLAYTRCLTEPSIAMSATTTRPTLGAMTNHALFNLAGDGA